MTNNNGQPCSPAQLFSLEKCLSMIIMCSSLTSGNEEDPTGERRRGGALHRWSILLHTVACCGSGRPYSGSD